MCVIFHAILACISWPIYCMCCRVYFSKEIGASDSHFIVMTWQWLQHTDTQSCAVTKYKYYYWSWVPFWHNCTLLKFCCCCCNFVLLFQCRSARLQSTPNSTEVTCAPSSGQNTKIKKLHTWIKSSFCQREGIQLMPIIAHFWKCFYT